MKRVSVRSAMLRSVGYDAATQTLELEFEAGTIYQYAGVPEFVHRALMKADSKGEFFSRAIDGRFATIQVK